MIEAISLFLCMIAIFSSLIYVVVGVDTDDHFLEMDNTPKKDYLYQFLMEYNSKFVTEINEEAKYKYDHRTARLQSSTLNRSYDTMNSVNENSISRSYDVNYTTPDMFGEMCFDYLLHTNATSDDYISTQDFNSFFEYLCDSLGIDDCEGDDIPFWSLSLYLQIRFGKFICPDDLSDEETIACIGILHSQVTLNNTFGLVVSEYTTEVVEMRMSSLCRDIYGASTVFHHGTFSPTPIPTALDLISSSPSIVPPKSSMKPSPNLSHVATSVPSSVLSISPSTNHSIKHTLRSSVTSNSIAPSEKQGKTPSSKETDIPSMSPSLGAGTISTTAPSTVPSILLSMKPSSTDHPTMMPNKVLRIPLSVQPSMPSSSGPSILPSIHPSIGSSGKLNSTANTSHSDSPSSIPSKSSIYIPSFNNSSMIPDEESEGHILQSNIPSQTYSSRPSTFQESTSLQKLSTLVSHPPAKSYSMIPSSMPSKSNELTSSRGTALGPSRTLHDAILSVLKSSFRFSKRHLRRRVRIASAKRK